MKELKGCTTRPERPHVYPPMDAEYTGERVEIWTCPVNIITPDLLGLFRSWQMADGKLQLSEQESVAPPYLEAWDCATRHASLASAYRVKRGRNG